MKGMVFLMKMCYDCRMLLSSTSIISRADWFRGLALLIFFIVTLFIIGQMPETAHADDQDESAQLNLVIQANQLLDNQKPMEAFNLWDNNGKSAQVAQKEWRDVFDSLYQWANGSTMKTTNEKLAKATLVSYQDSMVMPLQLKLTRSLKDTSVQR